MSNYTKTPKILEYTQNIPAEKKNKKQQNLFQGTFTAILAVALLFLKKKY